MAEFVMPSLGADMESATMIEWAVKPGDSVQRGDVVASVETAKGIIDIEIFDAGVIGQLLAEPGEEVAVGAVIATYQPARAGLDVAPDAKPAQPAPTAKPQPGVARVGAPPAATAATRGRLSPAARRRAGELGLDVSALKTLTGSGPGGALTSEDIDRAAAPVSAGEKAAPPKAAPAKPADMRTVIGQAMSRSKREIPHYYLGTTIDMTLALAWLESWNAARDVTERVLPGALLLKAVALALEQVMELNGFWRDDRFEPGEAINVGTAIRLRQGGLIAPAIADANRKSIATLMSELRDLVQRARTGHLRGAELTNGTITVSSLGEGSVETVYPVIYPPQVAIVGFGSILQRPWCADGKLIAAPVIQATLSADHRVSDGYRGAVFLTEIDRQLQQPEELRNER
jgi:pyruvate dehydrogenase E2 component (dihydrolipoamide acetyltransferase)